MSRWKESYDKLEIHETVKSAIKALDFDSEHLGEDVVVEYRRLKKSFEFLKDVLAGIDPELAPDALLTNMANHLNQQVLVQITNYKNNCNSQHLKSANDQFTIQIPNLLQLAGVSKPKESINAIRGVEDAYDKFCIAVEKTENDFTTFIEDKAAEISRLSEQTSKLSSSIESLKTATDRQISTWQAEFTEAQTTRAEEHSKAQIERGKKYDEVLREFKSDSEKDRAEITNKHDEALQDNFETYNNNAAARTKSIEEMHAAIKTLHGLAANDSVAGGYKKGADDERRAAFLWSLASMGCYSLIMLWVLFKDKLGFGVVDIYGVDWPLVVTTVSVTAVAFVAAQFAGKQSRVRRMNEQRMRWFSFEIAAIDPFISSLPAEVQQNLKQQLSEKLFGQDRVIEDKPSRVRGLDPDTIKTVIEPITEAIKIVRK